MPVTVVGQHTVAIRRRSSAAWYGADVDGANINQLGFQVLLEQVQFDIHDGPLARTLTINRPKAVEGYVWNVGGDSRAELVPIGELANDGHSEFRMQGHLSYTIGGHIVAVSLTGPDEPVNLLSVCGNFNQQMGAVEHRIRNAAAYPQKIRVEVNSYFDQTVPPLAWVPNAVTYHFKEGSGNVSVPITQDAMPIQMVIPDAGNFTAAFQKAKLEMEQAKWTVEAAGTRFQGGNCLPPVQLRPYAFLDYIAFDKKGHYDGVNFDDRFLANYLQNVSRKAGFAAVDLDGWFRRIMLTANAATHQTVLTSDAYGDNASLFETKGGLVVQESISGLVNGGGVNAPEIDHIFPYDQGGANCFSNARLTSKSYNAAKRDSVKNFELMSAQAKTERYNAWVDYIKTTFPGQYAELVRQGYI